MIPASGAGGRGSIPPTPLFLVFGAGRSGAPVDRVSARAPPSRHSFQRLRRRRCAASTSPQSTADGGDDHDAHSDVRVSRAWRRVSRVRGRGPRGGSARAFAPPRPYPASWPAAVHARARRPSRAGRALLSRILARASLASPRELRLRASSDDGAVDAAPAAATEAKKPATHQLITFFCFTEVPDYEAEVAEHRAFVEENGLEIRGRIYINQQGINAQMSGKGTDGERYARWVESRPHFNGMRISIYPTHEQAHPKLSLRYKPQLVQLEGGTSHLPVHDPSRRGTPLKPSEWHDMLGDVIDKKSDAPVLLDVRNGTSGTSVTSAAPNAPCRRASARRWRRTWRKVLVPWRAWISPGPS